MLIPGSQDEAKQIGLSEDIFGLGYAQPILSNCQNVNIKLVLE